MNNLAGDSATRRARHEAALLLVVYLPLYRACQAKRLIIHRGRSHSRRTHRGKPRPRVARIENRWLSGQGFSLKSERVTKPPFFMQDGPRLGLLLERQGFCACASRELRHQGIPPRSGYNPAFKFQRPVGTPAGLKPAQYCRTAYSTSQLCPAESRRRCLYSAPQACLHLASRSRPPILM